MQIWSFFPMLQTLQEPICHQVKIQICSDAAHGPRTTPSPSSSPLSTLNPMSREVNYRKVNAFFSKELASFAASLLRMPFWTKLAVSAAW